MTRRLLPVLVGALLLTGCQSSTTGDWSSVEAVAQQLGCSDTLEQRNDLLVSYEDNVGYCWIGNAGFQITDYGSEGHLEEWREVNRQLGRSEDQLGVTVGLVFVMPSNPELLDEVRATLLEGAPPLESRGLR